MPNNKLRCEIHLFAPLPVLQIELKSKYDEFGYMLLRSNNNRGYG